MIVFCPTEFPLCSIGQSCSYFDILFHSNLWLFFKSRNRLIKLPSYCMLYCSLLKSATVTQLGDREWNRTNVPNKSTPSVPTQSMKGCTTPPRSMPPTFYEQQCGFFYVPKESEQWKLTCKTGPTGFCPYIYLRRLEWLTTCRCHNKGSIFSSVFLRPWLLVRLGFEQAISQNIVICQWRADWLICGFIYANYLQPNTIGRLGHEQTIICRHTWWNLCQ